jgi:hypothetical protein
MDPNSPAVRALTTPFTIAVLPDTQFYSTDPDYTVEFEQQIDWVLNNAEAPNIVTVSHLGDVVDSGTDDGQWSRAMTSLNPLLQQGRLPFSIVRGNHDEPGYFLDRLGPSVKDKKSFFMGAAPLELAQAQIFRVENAHLLHIGFQKDPTDANIARANAFLGECRVAGFPVIVSTHDQLVPGGRGAAGNKIWGNFIKNHLNISPDP